MLRIKIIGFLLILVSCGKPTSEQSSTSEFLPIQYFGYSMRQKTLALTFDDGPHETALDVAEYLNELGIKAGFFFVSNRVFSREQEVSKIAAMGHLIANHSRSHPDLTEIASPIEEIRVSHEVLQPYMEENRYLFRAPFGRWRADLADQLNNAGFDFYVGPIRWDIGSGVTERYAGDWECWKLMPPLSVEECGQGYLNEITDKKKGIVLLHDRPNTLPLMKWLLPRLIEKGYRFVRIDEVPEIRTGIDRATSGVP